MKVPSRSALTAIALVGLLLAVAPASAHGAAPPPDHLVRLLHDCEDDYYGGHGLSSNPPGHELHALDMREAWEAGLGSVLVFRVIGEGKDSGDIHLDFRLAGKDHRLTWRTHDGTTWTGTVFDRVSGPFQQRDAQGVPDGDRWFIEGTVRLASLGADVGDTLRDYTLTGMTGGQVRDRVPGYDGNNPLITSNNCPERYQKGPHNLAGPVHYIRLAIDDPAEPVPPAGESTVRVQVTNLLRDSNQRATITVEVGSGVEAAFRDGNGRIHESVTLVLPRGGSSSTPAGTDLVLTATQPGAQGTATVTVTTDLGGRLSHSFPYTVADTPAQQPQGPGPGAPSTPPPSGPGGDDAHNDSPAPAALVALVALIAVAAIRRRP